MSFAIGHGILRREDVRAKLCPGRMQLPPSGSEASDGGDARRVGGEAGAINRGHRRQAHGGAVDGNPGATLRSADPGQLARRLEGGKFRRFRRKKVCIFCKDPEIEIDYKLIELLRRFVSDRGRIFPRRRSGNCAKHQRKIAEAAKQARFVALLPYVND